MIKVIVIIIIIIKVKVDYTFFLYKHEEKFTPASIMLSFLRISGSNYAYDMIIIFQKILKMKM